MCANETSSLLHCVAIRHLLAVGLLLVTATGVALAEDWPEFRGPTGQGLASATAPPVQWNVPDNVRWKVPVPGKGWSSPIVHDGRVLLTTAVPSEEDPPKQQSLRALCLDAATGDTLWDVEVFLKQMRPDEKINPKNSFASPTPITDGDYVFVHFGPDGTACLDRDGKRIWSNDRLRYNSVHGAGGSPVFAGSRLIFPCDGAEAPCVVALERKSGTVAWRTPRPPITSPKWSFGTPLVIEVEGERQLVSPAAGMVCSYDPSWAGTLESPVSQQVVDRTAACLFARVGVRLHRLRRPGRTSGNSAHGLW